MTPEHILAFCAFAFVSSITPGPNNLMLLASGANFGFRRSLPHMLGIGLGFTILLLATGAGLAQVFQRIPHSQNMLQICASLYMIWLAWKIATARPATQNASGGRPMTCLEAAAFQWVNPKGWAMALTANTVYVGSGTATSVLLIALIFALINLPSVGCWAYLGAQMARWLSNPRRMRLFNLIMAALLIVSLYPVLNP